MNHTLKAIIVAIALIVVGSVLAGCSLLGMDGAWDMLMGSGKLVTTQETITEDFNNIDIDIIEADLELLPSPDGTCYYKAETYDNMFCTAKVENGTLKIGQDDNRKWYQHIGIYWEKTSLALYLPKDAYEQLTFNGSTSDLRVTSGFQFQNVTVVNSTGDIRLVGLTAKTISATTRTGNVDISQTKCDNISVSTSTGDCQLETLNVAEKLLATSSTGEKFLNKVDCGNLNITATTGDTSLSNVKVSADAQMESSTGDWELYNVMVSGDAKLESSAGDWEFDRFDAANITINTDTGDVEGTILSDKVFFVDTDTGNVDVPWTTSGGNCQITTDTGDIEIDIVP